MDNETLTDVLQNAGTKQFWIALWGYPDEEAPRYESEKITAPELEHWFSFNPASMNMGDVIFLHRIKAASILYVGEVISEPRRATREEIIREPGHERWEWTVGLKNLTPTFGSRWFEFMLKTFALNKEYNGQNPLDRVNIGKLKYGAPVRISSGFAQFLLLHIMGLQTVQRK